MIFNIKIKLYLGRSQTWLENLSMLLPEVLLSVNSYEVQQSLSVQKPAKTPIRNPAKHILPV